MIDEAKLEALYEEKRELKELIKQRAYKNKYTGDIQQRIDEIEQQVEDMKQQDWDDTLDECGY